MWISSVFGQSFSLISFTTNFQQHKLTTFLLINRLSAGRGSLRSPKKTTNLFFPAGGGKVANIFLLTPIFLNVAKDLVHDRTSNNTNEQPFFWLIVSRPAGARCARPKKTTNLFSAGGGGRKRTTNNFHSTHSSSGLAEWIEDNSPTIRWNTFIGHLSSVSPPTQRNWNKLVAIEWLKQHLSSDFVSCSPEENNQPFLSSRGEGVWNVLLGTILMNYLPVLPAAAPMKSNPAKQYSDFTWQRKSS